MRYQTKPTYVTAEEWQPGKEVEWVCHCKEHTWFGENKPHVHAFIGAMSIKPGDMIVTNDFGSCKPMTKEEFMRKYEPVENPGLTTETT